MPLHRPAPALRSRLRVLTAVTTGLAALALSAAGAPAAPAAAAPSGAGASSGAATLLPADPAAADTAALPHWREVSPGVDRQFRGVAAVSRSVAWLAGVQGTVLRTTDGGRTWDDVSPRGIPATLQFRDIEALDTRRAVALTIGEGGDSRAYRTVDGGAHWSVTVNDDPAAFYDCLAFFSPSEGIALSDPVDGRFRIARTTDGGLHWRVQSSAGMPAALPGEFAFAASGTCLVASGRQAWIASGGGATSRVFHSTDAGHTWTVSSTPVPSGDAAGIFSLAVRPYTLGVTGAPAVSGTAVLAVGGDFTVPAGRVANAAVSPDSRRWFTASRTPGGYRSGVAWLPGTVASAVAVGPTGSDVSTDAGLTWTPFDGGSFDTVQCASDGGCWASGSAGRVGVLAR